MKLLEIIRFQKPFRMSFNIRGLQFPLHLTQFFFVTITAKKEHYLYFIYLSIYLI